MIEVSWYQLIRGTPECVVGDLEHVYAALYFSMTLKTALKMKQPATGRGILSPTALKLGKTQCSVPATDRRLGSERGTAEDWASPSHTSVPVPLAPTQESPGVWLKPSGPICCKPKKKHFVCPQAFPFAFEGLLAAWEV